MKINGKSVLFACFSCRMSDRGGEADQRLQPSSEVHHPHGGTKIQIQVQDGGGELVVQLLQEHHAAGRVRTIKSTSHQSFSQSINQSVSQS